MPRSAPPFAAWCCRSGAYPKASTLPDIRRRHQVMTDYQQSPSADITLVNITLAAHSGQPSVARIDDRSRFAWSAGA
jgi:hypothetical protein